MQIETAGAIDIVPGIIREQAESEGRCESLRLARRQVGVVFVGPHHERTGSGNGKQSGLVTSIWLKLLAEWRTFARARAKDPDSERACSLTEVPSFEQIASGAIVEQSDSEEGGAQTAVIAAIDVVPRLIEQHRHAEVRSTERVGTRSSEIEIVPGAISDRSERAQESTDRGGCPTLVHVVASGIDQHGDFL